MCLRRMRSPARSLTLTIPLCRPSSAMAAQYSMAHSPPQLGQIAIEKAGLSGLLAPRRGGAKKRRTVAAKKQTGVAKRTKGKVHRGWR